MHSFLNKAAIASVALLLVTGCAGESGYGSMSGGGASAEVISELKNQVGDTIFYEFDSSALTVEAKTVLDRQADFMKKYSDISVEVEGHCDERGPADYNLALGERRANVASKYIQSMGIDAVRLSTQSYGKERPAVEGHDEAAWSANRRAVTVIKGGDMSSENGENS